MKFVILLFCDTDRQRENFTQVVFHLIYFTYNCQRTLGGALAELPCFTSCEPNYTNKDQKLFAEDKQVAECQGLAEHEDLRVKPPILPPTEHCVDLRVCCALLASALYLQERERSKCGTITRLPLCTRTLDVQFISRSDKYRETCRARQKHP